MTDKNRTLVVRAILGVVMTIAGGCMLAGCPLNQAPPLNLRATDTVAVHANH